jgi:hypothetical protein
MNNEREKFTESVENIEDTFNQMQNKNDMAEVLKELFDKGKIYLISDLSRDEIKLCTRIYMIAKLKNMPIWEKGLQFYTRCLLSKDRKSRKEIIDAIRGYPPQQSGLGRLNPFSWNR